MSFDLKNAILPRILLTASLILTTGVSQNEALCREGEQLQLINPLAEGSCVQVRTVLRARGHLRMKPIGASKESRVPIEVHGILGYHERLLDADGQSAARHYHESQATLQINGRAQSLSLPGEQRWIGCRYADGQIKFNSIDHPLTAQERDMIDLQGNSLLLPQLVPTRVRRQQRWPVNPQITGALVGLDTIVDAKFTGYLRSANSQKAVVEFEGTVAGGIDGAQADLDLSGTMVIHVPSRSIESFDLKIRERRAPNEGQPGLDVTAELHTELKVVDIPATLRADKIAALLDPQSTPQQPLRFASDDLGIRLLHSDQWKVVLQRYDVAVLRQLDRGELLANMTINSLPNGPPNKQLAMKSFQDEIQKALAERHGQMLEATESTTKNGVRVLRVTAAGAVEKVSLYWVYYHLSNETGRRATIVLTVESDKVERYAEAERSLIETWEFIPRTDRPEKTTEKDGPDARR